MLSSAILSLIQAPDIGLSQFLHHGYRLLSAELTPIVDLMAILYWATWGYQLYAGRVTFVSQTLLIKVAVTIFLFTLMQWDDIALVMYEYILSSIEYVVGLLVDQTQNNSVILEHLWQDIGQISAFLMDDKPMSMMMQGYGLMLLNCGFVIGVVGFLVFSKIGIAITLLLCPFFIIFFFFPQTRHWFMNWVNHLFQFVLLFLFVHLLLHVSYFAFSFAINEIREAKEGLLFGTVSVTTTAYIYVVEGLLLYLLVQTKAWSSSIAQSIGGFIQQLTIH